MTYESLKSLKLPNQIERENQAEFEEWLELRTQLEIAKHIGQKWQAPLLARIWHGLGLHYTENMSPVCGSTWKTVCLICGETWECCYESSWSGYETLSEERLIRWRLQNGQGEWLEKEAVK